MHKLSKEQEPIQNGVDIVRPSLIVYLIVLLSFMTMIYQTLVFFEGYYATSTNILYPFWVYFKNFGVVVVSAILSVINFLFGMKMKAGKRYFRYPRRYAVYTLVIFLINFVIMILTVIKFADGHGGV